MITMAAIRVLVRRDILAFFGNFRGQYGTGAVYKGRHEWCAKFLEKPGSRGAVAVGRGAGNPGDGDHRWPDPADGIGTLDHGVEAHHGRVAATERCAVGRRLRQVSTHSAIC